MRHATVIASGRRAEVGGWYLDQHGHRLFLRSGEAAPICPHLGPATATWRLVAEVPSPRRR